MASLSAGSALLVCDDDVFSHSFTNYIQADGIAIHRVRASELIAGITTRQTDCVVIDMSARSVDADLLMLAATRCLFRKIPCLLISGQTRAEVKPFAAVVRAADVICKHDRLSEIAARLRMWVASSRVDRQVSAAATERTVRESLQPAFSRA